MKQPLALFPLLGLAALAFAAVPASAQDLASDAKCFIVSNMFAKAGDAKSKEAAVKASYFYLGRLTGLPEQIRTAIATQGRTVTPQNAPATMQACARTVEQKALQLRQIGQGLSRPQGR